MSSKRRDEVIRNLTNTIKSEKEKPGGGNLETIEKLSKILESIEDGTYISKVRNKKK